MSQNPRVLLVSPPGGVAREFAPTLRAAGFAPKVVGDFALAKEILSTCPELLITEVKLGAFNGLHLAIRAGVQGTPTIVIGDSDPVFEAEARRQHATYITPPIDHDKLLGVVKDLLSAVLHVRRSPRKQVPLLDAFVNDVPARVLDVSYEGIRLEAAEADSEALPSQFRVRLPLFNFSCDAERVWTSPLNGGGASANGLSCGAQLSIRDVDMAVTWRTLVDALPGLAVSV